MTDRTRQRHELDLPPFVPGDLQVTPLTAPDPATAAEHVAAFVAEGARGWLCHTERVIRVDGPGDLRADAGPLLQGELALGHRTLTLRYVAPETGYDARLLTRLPGDAYHVVTLDYAGVAPPTDESAEPTASPRICYEMYWPADLDLDCDAATQGGPRAARFVGFIDQGGTP